MPHSSFSTILFDLDPMIMSFGQGAVETFGQFGQGGSLEVLFFDNPHELLDLDSCE